MRNIIILGSQWGDEGKGKIVDLFAERFDIVASRRTQRGTTVFIGEKKYVLKLIPSGILRPGKKAVIGNGLVLDPAALLSEIETLESAGVTVMGNLFISNRAHVLFPAHRMMEKMSEGREGRISIGTTSRGIGPCYEDKIARRGIRVADLLDTKFFHGQYDSVMEEKATIAKTLASTASSILRAIRGVRSLRRADTADGLRYLGAVESGDPRRQDGDVRRRAGTMLDIDHGTYRFVTSSSATPAELAPVRAWRRPASGRSGRQQGVHHARGRRTLSDRGIRRGGRPDPRARQGIRSRHRASAALWVVGRAAVAVHGEHQRLRQPGDHEAGCAR